MYLSFKDLVLNTLQIWNSKETIAGDVTLKVSHYNIDSIVGKKK